MVNNIFKHLLIVSLMITLVFSATSCGGRNGVGVASSEYKLEMPSQALLKQLKKEYVSFHKYNGFDPPTIHLQYWYGSYGNVHFVMIDDEEYHDSLWSCEVAGYVFNYLYGNQITVWVNGQFLHLDEAYDKGLITEDMIKKIAEINNNNEYLKLYKGI